MIKYIWAWSDSDAVYMNCSDSLTEILDNVLHSYFSTVEIELKNNIYLIKVSDSDLENDFQEFQIDENYLVISTALQKIASDLDRPDKFDIKQLKILLAFD